MTRGISAGKENAVFAAFSLRIRRFSEEFHTDSSLAPNRRCLAPPVKQIEPSVCEAHATFAPQQCLYGKYTRTLSLLQELEKPSELSRFSCEAASVKRCSLRASHHGSVIASALGEKWADLRRNRANRRERWESITIHSLVIDTIMMETQTTERMNEIYGHRTNTKLASNRSFCREDD